MEATRPGDATTGCDHGAVRGAGQRRAHLAALDLAALESLRAHLKSAKAWPSR